MVRGFAKLCGVRSWPFVCSRYFEITVLVVSSFFGADDATRLTFGFGFVTVAGKVFFDELVLSLRSKAPAPGGVMWRLVL